MPAGTFATQDGHINVTSLHDRMFIGLCRAIEKEKWATDSRLATVAGRFEHAEKINTALNLIFREKSTSHWEGVLSKHGVVCGKVSGYADFLDDAQVKHRQIFHVSTQNGSFQAPIPKVPGTESEGTERRAPRQGEDTLEILAELGLSETQRQGLLDSGAVSS